MIAQTLFLMFLVPIVAGILVLLIPSRAAGLRTVIAVFAALTNFIIAAQVFGKEATFTAPLGGFGFSFSLRLYHFNSFIIWATGLFAFLIALFCTAFLHEKKYAGYFYSFFLLTLGFANGAALADDLIVLLFFWEGMLLTTFGLIIIGHKDAYRTAVKAFIIAGVTDLCLMIGIAMTSHLAHTTQISAIHLPLTGAASIAFIFLMIGAIARAGSMPFHSWIPDAAVDAPLPFMAFMPAALEKLLGIYLLTRISFDLYQLNEHSWVSTLLMIIGTITILLAVMMALIQKDFKRLLSFHAISQVGYMILGIGTAVPAGIVGGLFHMLNNALYKSCLFLTGGAVEHATGTTDLRQLGGLGRKMPLTFLGFFIAAIAISDVPPLNGFFSKELIYDGALERGRVFYIAALLGSFFTAVSFLKLGHSAFLGKSKQDFSNVKDAPTVMLVPILVIAGLCIVFGLYNSIPLHSFIQPALSKIVGQHEYAGMPKSYFLIAMTLVALLAALLNHFYGVKKTGEGLGAIDHIHYAPVLHDLYDHAEKRHFDPYEIAMKAVRGFSILAFVLDRVIDWVYNAVIPGITGLLTASFRAVHNGSYVTYIIWSLLGFGIVVASFIYG